MDSKKKNYIFIILIILFYFIVAHTNILALDDFRWGSSRGLARMHANFDNYNGRYLGNYTIIAMTRSYLAQILIPLVINTGIVLFIYKIFDRLVDLAFIMFFILTLPFTIYQQTYGFMSGFANYNTALFFILAIIYLMGKNQTKTIDLISLFAAGFAVQLFLENVSVVNIVILPFLAIYSIVKKEKRIKTLLLLISNLLGSFLMFTNTAYVSDATSRGLSNLDFSIIPQTFFTQWSELFFKNNIILIILLSLAIYFISDRTRPLRYIIWTIPTYFTVRYHLDLSWENLPTELLYFEGFLVIALILLSFYLVYKTHLLNDQMKAGFYLFFLLAGLYAGPFLAISMDGEAFVFPRNVLTSYILIAMAIMCLYLPLIKSQYYQILKKNLSTIAIALMFVIGSMSIINHYFNNMRIKSAKEAISAGAETVSLERLPFEKIYYSWNLSERSAFMPDFKEYYEIDEQIEIEQVPLENKYTDE